MLFYAFIKCLWASIVLPTKFTSCHLLNIMQSSLTKFKKKNQTLCFIKDCSHPHIPAQFLLIRPR